MRCSASRSSANCSRLEMNPGTSRRTSTGRLPRRRASAVSTSQVASDVFSPLMISTTGMIWAGLAQCKPAKRCGCDTASARREMDSPEVLVVKIAVLPHSPSSAWNNACLAGRSSAMDSDTRWTPARSASAAVGVQPRQRRPPPRPRSALRGGSAGSGCRGCATSRAAAPPPSGCTTAPCSRPARRPGPCPRPWCRPPTTPTSVMSPSCIDSLPAHRDGRRRTTTLPLCRESPHNTPLKSSGAAYRYKGGTTCTICC